MFRTTLCAVALSAVSFVSNAVETLQYFRYNYNKRGNWYQ